ncbi:IclR family transcriptional regulator [Risungbinella massiliensis]|uniref:IclR family transcriptional regulator n=1 Tax=Risungbinella massiliensis TaxID=1329796 RepID=UPI0005CBEBFB|nr:IclR family transcriptional regulator [Risungbinella massiliensis]
MTEEKKTVRSAERALDLLLCFLHGSRLSLTELAEQTGLSKSTVFRLLATLENKGFLERDIDTEKYHLGLRVWELASRMNHLNDPAILLLPLMERLRDQLEETVSLYIREGNERIRIQAVESHHAIRRVAPIGVRMHLSVGASSKVLMAYETESIRENVMADPDWPEGVARTSFRNQLQDVREKGYAISIEEREAGTAAISVPILRRDGSIRAALALSGPISRMSPERMEEMAPVLQQVAQEMSERW